MNYKEFHLTVGSRDVTIETGKQIGRASCRERV